MPNVLIPDYQNPTSEKGRWRRWWIPFAVSILLIGFLVSILLPSIQFSRTVYQTMPVIVTDAKTGQPIAGASVSTPEYEDISVVTDGTGTANLRVELIATGTDFSPYFNSQRYSASADFYLRVSASGYASSDVTIPVQGKWMLFGIGTHPVWRINASLEPATQPSGN